MHELSITYNLLRTIEREAQRQKFERVSEIKLQVGKLSCIEPEALEFCFRATAKGTPAEGAELKIELVPGRGRCRNCHHIYEIEQFGEPCPECGAFGPELLSGSGIKIKYLSVE